MIWKPILAFVIALAFSLAAPVAAFGEKRVALVIGNSAYRNVPELINPKNDASDMAAKLQGLGFEVVSGLDLDLAQMRATVREFVKRLDGAHMALYFYAGHGLQVNGVNYMAPVDARLSSFDDLEFEAMPMDPVLAAMERNSKVNLAFLDACRNNPLAQNLARSMGTRSVAVGNGLARLGSGIGSLIAFSTQPGNVALDGSGRNSPFTSALLKHLGTPGQDITRDLIFVRRDVLEATGGKQVPWDNSSLTGEVILLPGELAAPEANETAKPDGSFEITYWESIKTAEDKSFFRKYLERFPGGMFAELANMKIGAIEAREAAEAAKAESERKAAEEEKKKLEVAKLSEPEAKTKSGMEAYDGIWRAVRRAKNASCGWKELDANIFVSNGRVSSGQWEGKIAEDGSFKLTLTFTHQGKNEMNIATGKIKGDAGSGQFIHVGGSCAGAFTLSKL